MKCYGIFRKIDNINRVFFYRLLYDTAVKELYYKYMMLLTDLPKKLENIFDSLECPIYEMEMREGPI